MYARINVRSSAGLARENHPIALGRISVHGILMRCCWNVPIRLLVARVSIVVGMDITSMHPAVVPILKLLDGGIG